MTTLTLPRVARRFVGVLVGWLSALMALSQPLPHTGGLPLPAVSTDLQPAARPAGPGDDRWQSGIDYAGIDGTVQVMVKAPNGDLLVGGSFTMAGGRPAGNIARWNGTTWQPLGTGLYATFPSASPSQLSVVNAIAIMPNGDILAGGSLAVFPNGRNIGVARWNGASWQILDGGVNGVVRALQALPNGDVVVGGDFATVGSTNIAAPNIARWSSTAGWNAMGRGTNGPVFSLARLPNGYLVVGGAFTEAGRAPGFLGIARWENTYWQFMGTGMTQPGGSAAVWTLTVLANGDLVAAGRFTTAGGVAANNIARWQGSTWGAIGDGFNDQVHAVLATPTGELLAGGAFTQSGVEYFYGDFARWNGSSWRRSGAHSSPRFRRINALALTAANEPVAGFTADGCPPFVTLACWRNNQWQSLNAGLNAPVQAVLALPNGDVVAGGLFTVHGFPGGDHVARWTPQGWQPMGQGLSGNVYCLVAAPNGDVLAGGAFEDVGGMAISRVVARWDGTQWRGLPTSPPILTVHAMKSLPNGDLLVTGGAGVNGNLPVLRWNGSTWQTVASLNQAADPTYSFIEALVQMPNGDLIAGGLFRLGGRDCVLARWDGSSWQALDASFGAIAPGAVKKVLSLALAPNGDLVVGGTFANVGQLAGADNIVRWDGATWHALGNGLDGFVTSLAALPNGDIVAGGTFYNTGSIRSIARWNGTAWQSLGTGTNGHVLAVGATPGNDIIAGGGFTSVGDGSKVMAYLGIYRNVLSTPDELTAPAPFTLAPNPATAQVRLEGARATTAEVYDALGRHLRTVPLTAGAATFDVGGLTPGVYVVRAGGRAQRLVVE